MSPWSRNKLANATIQVSNSAFLGLRQAITRNMPSWGWGVFVHAHKTSGLASGATPSRTDGEKAWLRKASLLHPYRTYAVGMRNFSTDEQVFTTAIVRDA